MIHSRDITYNLHKVVFLLDKIADEILEEKLGMTFSQFKILIAIDHKTMSQREIADYWDMTEAAVSRQIELLLDKKLVELEENPDNRRQHVLKLSQAGREMYDKGFKVLDEKTEEVFVVLDEREREVMTDGIHKLLKVICTKGGKVDCGCR